jgi:hypothetical protein
MATVTLSSLRSQVRQRADQENSTFISDAELDGYINLSAASLYDILVSRFEDYYTLAPLSFTISSGSTYALPSDFYKLRGLDRALSSTEFYSIPKYNFQERNQRSRNILRNLEGFNGLAYRIVGNTLYFLPEDQAQGSYRLWYIPTYTKLVNTNDTLDGFNGWEEYIILDAAIKCMTKEESDPTVLLMERKSVMDRIESLANNRDIGLPERVSSVRDYNDDDTRGFFY